MSFDFSKCVFSTPPPDPSICKPLGAVLANACLRSGGDLAAMLDLAEYIFVDNGLTNQAFADQIRQQAADEVARQESLDTTIEP